MELELEAHDQMLFARTQRERVRTLLKLAQAGFRVVAYRAVSFGNGMTILHW